MLPLSHKSDRPRASGASGLRLLLAGPWQPDLRLQSAYARMTAPSQPATQREDRSAGQRHCCTSGDRCSLVPSACSACSACSAGPRPGPDMRWQNAGYENPSKCEASIVADDKPRPLVKFIEGQDFNISNGSAVQFEGMSSSGFTSPFLSNWRADQLRQLAAAGRWRHPHQYSHPYHHTFDELSVEAAGLPYPTTSELEPLSQLLLS